MHSYSVGGCSFSSWYGSQLVQCTDQSLAVILSFREKGHLSVYVTFGKFWQGFYLFRGTVYGSWVQEVLYQERCLIRSNHYSVLVQRCEGNLLVVYLSGT